MDKMTKEQIAQIIIDPENQPNQFGKLIWNGNELVFEAYPNFGVAGISPNMPDELGEEIAKSWNHYKAGRLKSIEEIEKLEKELERVKGLVETAWFENGMDCGCEVCMKQFDKFKTENKI